MKGKLLGFALALLSVATIGVVQMQTQAYVDSSRDCDKYAVIYCGTMSPEEARNKYDQGAKIFQAMGISKGEISGNFKNGVVHRDGRVTVNGKVVATGARTAIRNMSGGSPISGTNAAIHSTSRMGSDQTAMVKFDQNGRFLFAIMKPCGNPVKANPTKPEPKPAAACKNLNVAKLERTKFRFDGRAEAKNGASIKSYTFNVFGQGGKLIDSKTVRTAKGSASYTYRNNTPGTYTVRLVVNTSLGEKRSQDCVGQFTVKQAPVAICKDLILEKIASNKFRFTAKAEAKHGAKINGYIFSVYNANGKRIATKTTDTSKESAGYTYSQATPGDYTAKVVVKTSEGRKDGKRCTVAFSVPPEEDDQTAVCKDLTVETISRTEFRFTATAEVTGNATINGYTFTVVKDNAVVETMTVDSAETSASVTYSQEEAGDYVARVVVDTSLGNRNGAHCTAPFTVTEEEKNPGIEVTKHVENVKYKRVGVNVEYQYQIAVTNTGEQNLTNVEVTDEPEMGITLLSASAGNVSGNVWTYTIPELAVGQTMSFTLQAKVPVYLAGILTNTVCVDAPEVPGEPDDCDTADVDVPTPGKVEVCNPETGEIIEVDEDEADQYVPVDSPECEEMKVCVKETNEVKIIKKSDFDETIHTTDFSQCKEVVPVTPTELPQTGAVEVAMQVFGATSLAGASAYYLASRRQRA